jgi:hypothetical protein
MLILHRIAFNIDALANKAVMNTFFLNPNSIDPVLNLLAAHAALPFISYNSFPRHH